MPPDMELCFVLAPRPYCRTQDVFGDGCPDESCPTLLEGPGIEITGDSDATQIDAGEGIEVEP